MSVGYNVSEASMDFNSGTNLTSGIQDRCCTRWWRSRNGFERWMVIVVIFLSTVIVALSIAVGILDQIAHPSEPEPAVVNPVAGVGNLFDHMEEQVNKASQLMADTEISFNQTLIWLKTVETKLSEFDDDTNRTKRFVEDIMAFGRYRRDVNSTQNNSTTVVPTVNVTPVVNSNTTGDSNGTDVNTTGKEVTPEITTQPVALNHTTPKLNQTTLVQVTQPPTTQSSNGTGINATTSPAPTTVNAVVANLTAELNNTKYLLNISSETLNEKIKELTNLNNTLKNQTIVLNTNIDLLKNQSLELYHLREELNETKNIVIQKNDQINDLNNTIKLTIEKLKKTNQTLMDTEIRITFLELFINKTTGILTPVLDILEKMDRPINQTDRSVMEAKKLLRQVNNTLSETDLPFKQKKKNQNQTQIMSDFLDGIEISLESIKTNFKEMEVQTIAITEPLKNVQAKLFKDADNAVLLSVMNETGRLFNQSVMNMKSAEISLIEINLHLTHTVANLTQSLELLSKIEVEVKITVKVNLTSVTTPMISLNTTTPLPNLNSTENSNITSNALKSSSTVLLSGKLEIFVLVMSAVIYQGYGKII